MALAQRETRWKVIPDEIHHSPFLEFPDPCLMPIGITVDPEVGHELVILARDGTGYLERIYGHSEVGILVGFHPFHTPYGPIGIDLWGLTLHDQLVWALELFVHQSSLNRDEALRELQSYRHLHLLICDHSNERSRPYEVQNTLRLDQVLQGHGDHLSQHPCTNLHAAKHYVWAKVPSDQLQQRLFSRTMVDESFWKNLKRNHQ